MLKAGVIKPSTSERAAPVVFEPKKCVTLRFCIDYRSVNEMTIRDSYPIPRIEKCIDPPRKRTCIFHIGLKHGY